MMPQPQHRYHSWLFVPADDERKILKALGSAADVVILDLEDAVATARKDEARSTAGTALKMPSRTARYVRVNDLTTGLTADDIAATISGRPDGYMLPKCEGPADIEALAALLRVHGEGLSPGIVAIATETARGVRNLMRLDWSHPSLSGLAWGGEDLSADLGASANRGADGNYLSPFTTARDLALYAAREAGVLALDAVFTDFRDSAALAEETRAGKSIGFDGKMAIHPAQVDVINHEYKPNEKEIVWARQVVSLFRDSGSGVAQLDGRMLDRPHLKAAERILRHATGDVD